MWEAKARGEIDRFPNGRRAKGLPPLSKDPTIRKAQRIIEARMAEQGKTVTTVPPTSWDQMTKADKLARATDLGLDVSMKILTDGGRLLDERGLEGMDPKLLAEVRGTALSIISDQIRIDAAALQASAIQQSGGKVVATEEQRLLDQAFAQLAAPTSAPENEFVPAAEGEDL